MLARILTLGLIGLALPAQAEEMFLKAKEVTVTGVADLKAAGSEAAARDLAIRNAQRNAIEEVIGALIESSFSAEQKESLKANKTTFESKVEERVHSKSTGFIERQTVVSEKKDGGTYTVTLKAVVKQASLAEELAQLKGIFAAANYPKVMLLLSERYTDKAGKQQWIDRPSIVPVIENELLARGFELVAKDQAEKLRVEGMQVYAELVGSAEKSAEIASKYGAEVVVIGSAEVKFSAFNELNDNLHYLSAVVNLQAVSASTAKVLASFEAAGKGAGVNEDLARLGAIKKTGPEVVGNLVERLVTAWREEAKGGKRFRVVLLKVGNYGKVARPFIKEMEKLPQVEAVKELNFGGKRLELEVIYNGQKDDLLDGIFEQIASQKKFKKLDKVMDRGDAIELTL